MQGDTSLDQCHAHTVPPMLMTNAQPGHEAHDFELLNDPAQVERVEMLLSDAATRNGFAKGSIFALRLSLHEAIANAFNHGHEGLSSELTVHVRLEIGPDQIIMEVTDQGPGFDPASIPDPTLEENLERGSGRGLLLINAYMTRAEYNAKGNALRMVYTKPE